MMPAPRTIKLSSTLPEGEHNGLLALHDRLVDQQSNELMVAVVMLDRRQLVYDDDDNRTTVPVLRVRRSEVMNDKDDSHELMLRQFERRNGQPMLPIDLEKDLPAVVDAGIDDNADKR